MDLIFIKYRSMKAYKLLKHLSKKHNKEVFKKFAVEIKDENNKIKKGSQKVLKVSDEYDLDDSKENISDSGTFQ